MEPAPPAPVAPSVYADSRISLLTQHGKEQVIAPILGGTTGCLIEHVTTYDTDLFGTFTRDIPRVGSQLDAARAKARKGMELSGFEQGVASEGSFGRDPLMGLFPWNTEIVVLIDASRDLEIIGVAEGKSNLAHLLTADWDAVMVFAERVKFPDHHLVLRPDGQEDPRIRKGIATWAQLQTAFDWALSQSDTGMVFLETDVRAHTNPTRMQMIGLATKDLARKLISLCPECQTPGFGKVKRVPGLPCRMCGAPTNGTLAQVHGCLKCSHTFTVEVAESRDADARFCDYCNP